MIRSTRPPLRARELGALLLAAVVLIAASSAGAESAWVKDEVRLNIRSGPGVQYRIMGGVQTGDALDILGRGDGWTKVRHSELGEGWIPEGYLQPSPPARVELERLQAEAAELRARVEELSAQSETLRAGREEAVENDASQTAKIERLTRENLELRAGARWPHWIAGGAIIGFGMLVGALLHRNATRRPSSRVRL